MILVLDLGSQYTQLIAKKLRAQGFESEVVSGKNSLKDLQKKYTGISGIILSGSPASVGEGVDPDEAFLSSNIPTLGICFGYQFLAKRLGAELISQGHREYGAAFVDKVADDVFLNNFPQRSSVWMSHGDSVAKLPDGVTLLLTSQGKPSAFRWKNFWAVQFHPEVYHSPNGHILLENFARDICGVQPSWSVKKSLTQISDLLSEQLKHEKEVVCAVSGGVDSTVVAVLLSQFVKVKALFVDHGFLRGYDEVDLKAVFSKYPNIELEVVDAKDRFWAELNGVSDPEEKRKIIGRLFIDVMAERLKNSRESLFAQGTIYSDVIESAANELAPSRKIKSHHNVGALPEVLPFKGLVEPLRMLFKDEVRELGKLLGISKEFLWRHPFPGPGLAIRCVGALSPERIEVLRQADSIFYEELVKRSLYQATWQALCVLLPIKSVGVMGDGRSFEAPLVLRAVSSVDAMTVEASEFPWKDLKEIASRLVNEVRGINRVVFDLTSKPPGTIEWE